MMMLRTEVNGCELEQKRLRKICDSWRASKHANPH
jgi:hypothetical protein